MLFIPTISNVISDKCVQHIRITYVRAGIYIRLKSSLTFHRWRSDNMLLSTWTTNFVLIVDEHARRAVPTRKIISMRQRRSRSSKNPRFEERLHAVNSAKPKDDAFAPASLSSQNSTAVLDIATNREGFH